MRKLGLLAPAVLLLASCGEGSPTWTLYRNGTEGGARIHLATFDADDTGGGTHMYNEMNCKAAAKLWAANAKEKAEATGLEPVSYWCEEGKFHA